MQGTVSDLTTYLHEVNQSISFSLCLFTLTAPEHICVTYRGGGGLVRGAEMDRKLYTENLDSLTEVIFFFFSLSLSFLRTVYIKKPLFLSVCQLSAFATPDNCRHGTPLRNRMGSREVETAFHTTFSPLAALGHGSLREGGRATCLPLWLLLLQVLSGL